MAPHLHLSPLHFVLGAFVFALLFGVFHRRRGIRRRRHPRNAGQTVNIINTRPSIQRWVRELAQSIEKPQRLQDRRIDTHADRRITVLDPL